MKYTHEIMYSITSYQGNAIRIVIRYHYTLLRTAKVKKITIPNSGEDVEKQDLSHIADRKVKWYNHSRK